MNTPNEPVTRLAHEKGSNLVTQAAAGAGLEVVACADVLWDVDPHGAGVSAAVSGAERTTTERHSQRIWSAKYARHHVTTADSSKDTAASIIICHQYSALGFIARMMS
jgi:hypothetical protein